MKIITVVGARPQIIKAAALSRVINDKFPQIEELILHTGQHYDQNMSDVFFEELNIPKPSINLNVGSSSHGKQTALMIEKIEQVLLEKNVDAIVVYGDTNSTLASAIAASKIHVPIVHIEAGLRSFNKKMPEEINRIMCDHSSTLLFSPTKTGYQNLIKEGFSTHVNHSASADEPNIYHCGDVMYDNSIYFSELSDQKSIVLQNLDLEDQPYILATVHRNDNTDDPVKINSIFSSFLNLTEKYKISLVLPLHPRTLKMKEALLDEAIQAKVDHSPYIKIIPPASFLDMIALEKNSTLIITDSGGVQKEAYFFQKPCVILRPQTEWVEIVKAKCATIVDTDQDKILHAVNHFLKVENLNFPPVFGDGKAAEFILQEMHNQFG
tara:strand:+ start:4624 stop:5766 length:1143 start_codon:yes stop_codon:yes gene_type:complete